jgi:hypothetical protein
MNEQLDLFNDGKGTIHRCKICCSELSTPSEVCSDECSEEWLNLYLSINNLKLKSNDD